MAIVVVCLAAAEGEPLPQIRRAHQQPPFTQSVHYSLGGFAVEFHIRGKWVCDQCETWPPASIRHHGCDGGNQRVAALDGRQLGLKIHRADLKPPVIARSGNASLRADAIWERRLNVGSAVQCRCRGLEMDVDEVLQGGSLRHNSIR